MKIKDYSLYLVTSRKHNLADRTTYHVCEDAVRGGIDILQMREKYKSREELITLGRDLSKLSKKNNVTFIVNDDPVLAGQVSADGVHLGQEDIKEYPIKQAREILGREKIIGVSTHSMRQFKEANDSSIDYIAFGPVFPTKTKDYSIGIDDIQKAIKVSSKPVVFIGGINIMNMDILLKQGARNIAVIRAITQAEDVTSRVREFKDKINSFKRDKITV